MGYGPPLLIFFPLQKLLSVLYMMISYASKFGVNVLLYPYCCPRPLMHGTKVSRDVGRPSDLRVVPCMVFTTTSYCVPKSTNTVSVCRFVVPNNRRVTHVVSVLPLSGP